MDNRISTTRYVFFLGSHPDLSANEVFGQLNRAGYEAQVVKVTPEYLLVELTKQLPPVLLKRLGGSTRIGRVVAAQATLWSAEELWQLLFAKDPKKLTIGFGTVGLTVGALRDLAFDLKKVAQEHGSKVRFILPRGRFTLLNAAQVIFNDVLTLPNRELVILKSDTEYSLVATTEVQDIAAYELRDIQRPVRDPRVGMLPPKLAQIMLNLATSHLPPTPYPLQPNSPPLAILDPFCGLGTVVQEGWLLGHTMTGSDSNRNNVTAAQKNVAWTMTHFASPQPKPHIRVHDVKEPFPPIWRESFDAIVTEPFLGRPLHAPLAGGQEGRYLADLADLYYTFFRHAVAVVKPGGHVLIVFPALRQTRKGSNFSLLPADFLDAVASLGYIPKQLSHPELPLFPPSERKSLLYSRPDALVGRELTLWEKR